MTSIKRTHGRPWHVHGISKVHGEKLEDPEAGVPEEILREKDSRKIEGDQKVESQEVGCDHFIKMHGFMARGML